MSDPLRLFLIAGEPSGDVLGAALMQGLKAVHGEVEFAGIGGEAMQAQGLSSLFPMSDLSVMGIAEVLPRLRLILRRIRQASAAVAAFAPDALITIDSPDFCLRVARKVKSRFPIPVIHYVAPSVWAWRPQRAQKMARSVDHVLTLLPFEPPYMERAGMSCDFVGHPIAGEAKATAAEIAELCASYGITDDDKLLLLLPGSRRGEVGRMLPILMESVSILRRSLPELKVILPAASPVAPMIKEMTGNAGFEAQVIDPTALGLEEAAEMKRAAFARADAALATSGTVSLEISAARTPMVIAYRANRLTEFLIKRLSRVDTATLANLVTQTRAIPEYLFENCQPGVIADELKALLNHPERAKLQREVSDQAMRALGEGGAPPGVRAANSVLQFLRK